jgi:dTDP-4-dehydrorhamnose reductase
MRVLLTGSTGLLGTYISSALASTVELVTPSRGELDVTKGEQVSAFTKHIHPDVVIHAAAFTDNAEAEKQRGDKEGPCWQVNVEGTRHIVEAAKAVGAYVIFISTGSVFCCQKHEEGHFVETDTPSSEDMLSWYGHTKAVAEGFIQGGSILRLSHLVGDSKSGAHVHRDYLERLLWQYHNHTLYPLFTDQFFPITAVSQVIDAIEALVVKRMTGAFHIATDDVCSPYALTLYALSRGQGVVSNIPTISFDEFIKTTSLPKRYSKRVCLSSDRTKELLGMGPTNWKQVVDSVLKPHS